MPGFTPTERRAGPPRTGPGAGGTPRAVTPGPEQGRSAAARAVLARAERAGLTPKRPESGRGRQAQSRAHGGAGRSCLPLATRPSSIRPSVYASITHPSVRPYTHPLSTHPPVSHRCTHPNALHLSAHPFVCPPVRPSVRVPTRPSPLPSVLPSTGPPGVCRATSVHRGCRAEQGDGAPGVPGRVRQGGALGPVGVPRALRRLQRQWGPCTAEGGRGYGLGTQGEGRGPDEGAWLWGAGRSWARLHRRTPSWARPPHRHPCWGALAWGPPAPRAPHGRKRGAGLAVMAACGGARPASSAFVKVQAVGWG